jgi:transcriptional regulator with XRE-family HTH domain
MTLIDELKARRKELGLTQYEIADRLAECGLTVYENYISAWECGKCRPYVDMLEAWGNVLGLKLKWEKADDY